MHFYNLRLNVYDNDTSNWKQLKMYLYIIINQNTPFIEVILNLFIFILILYTLGNLKKCISEMYISIDSMAIKKLIYTYMRIV